MTTTETELSISTLNIGAASKERARRILDEWIAPRSDDVFVLTETSAGAGTQLIVDELRGAGWSVFLGRAISKDRGVAIATRVAAHESQSYPLDDPVPGRCVVVDLQTEPRLQIFGMYVPNRGNDVWKLERKRKYLAVWLNSLAATQPTGLRILIGDLNVVPPSQQPMFLPQQQFEYEWYHALIQKIALCDLPQAILLDDHEPTWVAHTGEGYTYDHLLVDQPLKQHVRRFEYDHSTRKPGGITDHSALSATFDVVAMKRLHGDNFALPIQAELF